MTTLEPHTPPPPDDSWLFGWDPTPAIVSVWADRGGRAWVWQRVGGSVVCTEERFRPWIFAATLDDLPKEDLYCADIQQEGSQDADNNTPLVSSRADISEQRRFHYRRLIGPEHSYRYLLSANDEPALERAIVSGATARLGRQVKSLYDLANEYHRVGPVEQYLMASGRVYFRGLHYDDLHRLQFDLETTSLSPNYGRIFMVAVKDSLGLATTFEAPQASDEAKLIADLCALIRERDPDIIENHNLFGFDLPFLYERAEKLGVPLKIGRIERMSRLERYEEPRRFRGRRRHRYSLAGREMIDTLDAVWRHDFSARDMPGHGLKAAARYFGVAAPERTYIPGSEIFSTYQRDPETVRRYAMDDVTEVDGLSQRLQGAVFALAGMAPRRYERLASAGPAMGILEPMLLRAYLHNGFAPPRQPRGSEEGLGGHAGGAVHLFAEGVARQVVKADVASMYPSIMRVFTIGPACDRLGAFVYLVDRLTDLRLRHKKAAQSASPDSAEAHGHHAVQSAMKILINSAYGYMGAGSMALFADRTAADEVTRRGREILSWVIDALRERGMTLLEADTDGVYFSAPIGWSEKQERELVEEVAALLPEGIRLEYEGRYQSMFVHEVKNYALLTHDGDLIVRGGALRSSRSEPFGEKFLHDALLRLLTGDILGLHRAFLETVAALRERRLTPADVATLTRLTKTPQGYADSRSRLREAPYEALLGAGRTAWRVGNRIRFYKASDGTPTLLPDTTDEFSSDTGDEESDEARGVGTEEERAEYRAPRDYDISHYLGVFLTTYVSRLRKAFTPEDFNQLFRLDDQLGMFDASVEEIALQWI